MGGARIYIRLLKANILTKISKSFNLPGTIRMSLFASYSLVTNNEISWTAICRGAVIKAISSAGQEGLVGVHISTRVSRFNYGIDIYEEFVEGFHEPCDKGYVEREGGWFAVNQMRWYLLKVNHIEIVALLALRC